MKAAHTMCSYQKPKSHNMFLDIKIGWLAVANFRSKIKMMISIDKSLSQSYDVKALILPHCIVLGKLLCLYMCFSVPFFSKCACVSRMKTFLHIAKLKKTEKIPRKTKFDGEKGSAWNRLMCMWIELIPTPLLIEQSTTNAWHHWIAGTQFQFDKV